MGVVILMFSCLVLYFTAFSEQILAKAERDSNNHLRRRVIEAKGGPESVIWVVQLSDLHFSVHHPDRALDFRTLVAPALSMIKPSLVLITGDLTDGKSKDLLIMKQDEVEWKEYKKVMEDVVKWSGLDKNIFYDLRGNHDNFGVPAVGGSFDFFSNYSINGQLGRSGKVNSVTIKTGGRKHLFVGIDSTMSVGLRGPTNLFGHPTNELLTEIDSELSQWNSQSVEPVTKISFGHFPLSFSALSYSGKSLKNIFLKHALSAYLCGHLHTGFGKNLKCHHRLGHHFFQLNIHSTALENTKNCSSIAVPPVEEFWEWEMGDWRKSRAMRIVAIDSGFVSFLDMDFKSGFKKTIILPTFPLDSRFMSTSSSLQNYKCHSIDYSSYDTVRALVFSVSPIMSVVARVYDSEPGSFDMVMEAQMSKHVDNSSRGDLYTAVWNFKAFEDPSPVRYWLQIEAIDIMGKPILTELRPFSINGLSGGHSWTWTEFMVMGCQWASLYYPIFWACLLFIFSILIIPKVLTFTKGPYTYKSFSANKGFVSGITWVLVEFCRLSVVWFGMVVYLFYLILFPWFSGQVFTDGSGERKYMTYKGWVVQIFGGGKKLEFIGSPDIMVVVLPHICFVVLPSVLVAAALAAEKGGYRVEFLSLSGKKEDDYGLENNKRSNREISKFWFYKRWIRKILLVFCLPICWKHLKNCRAVMKAYEMNPFLHCPVYSFSVPLLLAYTIYKTMGVR